MRYFIKDKKTFPKQTGVYLIGFLGTNKVYIGSSSSNRGFYLRWIKHINNLKKNKQDFPSLRNAYNKYTQDKMFFEVLEVCKPENCLIREQFYLDKFNSYINGYNSRPTVNSNLGLSRSESSKNKIKKKFKKERDKKSTKVINLYINEKKSTRVISEELKISRSFIKKILKENNIQTRTIGETRRKEIFQYDINGNFLKRYESILDCAKVLNVNTNAIKSVINKESSHCKNYFFDFNKISKKEVIDKIKSIKDGFKQNNKKS